MSAIALRPARENDVSALAALHNRSFADGWSGQILRDLLRTPGAFALVAEAGSALLGFILARTAADEAEILTLAVDPAKRRQGAARALLAEAAALAGDRGATLLFLEVACSNTPAQALYRQFGFQKTGRRKAYYRAFPGAPAEDALILEARLPLRAQTLGKSGELD
jgi:ribosomal-protein-alanine N-acetyltransferase